MVCFLILVQIFNVLGQDVASPLKIERLVFDHRPTCRFARVHHCVVNMSVVSNLKSHVKHFHVFAFVLDNSGTFPFNLHIRRILEKCGSGAALKHRIYESEFLSVGLEDGVGQTPFFSFYEKQVERICV